MRGAHHDAAMEQSRTAGTKLLAGQALEMSGMLILAMPGIVLATGFFLLLNRHYRPATIC